MMAVVLIWEFPSLSVLLKSLFSAALSEIAISSVGLHLAGVQAL